MEGIMLSTRLLEKHYKEQNKATRDVRRSQGKKAPKKSGRQITRENVSRLKNVPMKK